LLGIQRKMVPGLYAYEVFAFEGGEDENERPVQRQRIHERKGDSSVEDDFFAENNFLSLARKRFQQDSVSGPNIMHYRHRVEPMVSCPYCGTFMFIEECVCNAVAKADQNFRCAVGEAYNCALSFTSMEVNLDKGLANNRYGVYTLRINGVVAHLIDLMTPVGGAASQLLQVHAHIHGPVQQARIRNNHFWGIP
ncbi:hypothetical protein BX616_009564, partial [Lobosporangium transversale]